MTHLGFLTVSSIERITHAASVAADRELICGHTTAQRRQRVLRNHA
jgi:hypothetical protein